MKRGLIGLLLVVMLLAGANVQAQGGLSDEELALLDRVIEARMQYETWTGYSEQASGVDMSSFTMSLGENNTSRSETTSWSRTASVIIGETSDNVQAEVGVVYSYEDVTTGEETVTTQYDISGELRVVDGVVYVKAAYNEATPDVPEVPEEWVTISSEDDLALYPTFEGFQIDDLLDKDTLDESLENLEQLRTIASEVVLETDTLEDGRPVEIIAVQLDNEGIAEFLGEDVSDNVILSALLETGNNSATLSFWLLADGTIYEMDSMLHLEGIGLDGHSISENLPEGVVLDMVMELGEYATYSPLAEAGEPAVAPE